MSLFKLILMAASLVVGAVAVHAQAIHPQWSWANGDITYYHRTGDTAALWRIDPDTGEKQVLLDDGAYYGNPSWSPDGSQIAYTAGKPNMRGDWQLYRMNIATGEQIQLTQTDARVMHASWSPDGKWVAHARMKDGNSDIWIVSADGKSERQLTFTDGREFHPKWGADSQHLVFDADGAAGREIHMLNVHSGAVQSFTGPDGTSVGVPALSPDLETLIFSCRTETKGQLCQLNLATGAISVVLETAEGGAVGGAFYAGDGKDIAFHLRTEEGYGIYRMALPDGTPQLLVR